MPLCIVNQVHAHRYQTTSSLGGPQVPHLSDPPVSKECSRRASWIHSSWTCIGVVVIWKHPSNALCFTVLDHGSSRRTWPAFADSFASWLLPYDRHFDANHRNTRLILDDLRCEGAKHALSIPQLLLKHSKEMQFKRDDLPQQHTGKLIKHDIEPASSVQSSLCPLQATLQALTLHFIHILCVHGLQAIN